jgi:hypothetical protein
MFLAVVTRNGFFDTVEFQHRGVSARFATIVESVELNIAMFLAVVTLRWIF